MQTPNFEELLTFLASTLEDGRVSRGERRALDAAFEERPLSKQQRRALLQRASELAQGRLARERDRETVRWLSEVAQRLATGPRGDEGSPELEILFAPDDSVAERIGERIERARESLQLCVFTITDNHLTRKILEAHERGVAVRVITDDLKSLDAGSDIFRLGRAGIAVRTDKDPDHMHHKFAILDQKTLLTGSYNWTVSASRHNRENLLISEDPHILEPYRAEFEKLWRLYAPA